MDKIVQILSDPQYSALITAAGFVVAMYLKKRGLNLPFINEALDALGHGTPTPAPAPAPSPGPAPAPAPPLANHPFLKGILDALEARAAALLATPPAPTPAPPAVPPAK